ncbi:MAG: thymidine phosphorylase [Chloroflexales bacterium]|nr:thymidine phosphorylase [Chloroflexales bacterium]
MRAVDIISKKRDGTTLTTEEIDFLIAGYTSAEIPDYQMAAWAMAVVLRGMDRRETTDLALAMARSGAMLDLHDIAPITVDKHSTGGVGDKTTLVLAPLLAAVGLPIAKMSGRGLGFSGGTIDKLESIPGLRTELSTEEFRRAVREIGLVVAAQTTELAPADKQLYALRDVTATVESIPLIAASVMSKKLAAGADCIVLDVKCGSGAFMHTLEQARQLAQTMVSIGQRAGRRCSAVISSMGQPLGRAVGNALEVREVVATLQGKGPPDLVELCLTLGVQLALMARDNPLSPVQSIHDDAEARSLLEQALTNGAAWNKFRQMIANQGGDLAVLDSLDGQDSSFGLPRAPIVVPLNAQQTGYVTAINTYILGLILNELGGGRKRKGDPIDSSVGLVMHARLGDRLEPGSLLLDIHAASIEDAERVTSRLLAAYTVDNEPVTPPPLIFDIIKKAD